MAALLTAIVLGMAGPADLRAQILSGVIRDAATGTPIAGAAVGATGTEQALRAETLADEDGRFTLHLPHADRWVLTIQRLGFHPFTSDGVDVRTGEWLVLEVTLAQDAIALDPIVVTARRSAGSPAIRSFYDRRDRGARSGFGRFVAREEIERSSFQRPTDALRGIAGIRVVRGPAGRGQGVRMAGGCTPAIFIDGMQINRVTSHDSLDDYVSVLDIEGIEVYRGATSQVPQYHDARGCGLLLVWTRGGFHDPDSRFSWRPVLGALAAIGAFFLFIN